MPCVYVHKFLPLRRMLKENARVKSLEHLQSFGLFAALGGDVAGIWGQRHSAAEWRRGHCGEHLDPA